MDTDEQLHEEFYKLEFAVSRGIRYYTARAQFWLTLLKTVEIMGLVLNAGAFAFLFRDEFIAGRVVVAISSFLSVVTLCFQATSRWELNIAQKRRFHELLELFPVNKELESYELLKKIKDARNSIEKDDDTLFKCLSVLCHNEECDARDMPEAKHPLTWIQSHIGTIFPLKYSEKTVKK